MGRKLVFTFLLFLILPVFAYAQQSPPKSPDDVCAQQIDDAMNNWLKGVCVPIPACLLSRWKEIKRLVRLYERALKTTYLTPDQRRELETELTFLRLELGLGKLQMAGFTQACKLFEIIPWDLG